MEPHTRADDGIDLLRVETIQPPSAFFFSSRRRHTRCLSDWSSDVCSSDLKSCGNPMTHGIFASDSAGTLDLPRDASFMTLFSTAQHIARGSRERSRGHMIPIVLGCAVTSGAMALVAYLLWPTWGADASSSPARLPVSIGATLFNVPTLAIRVKIQRHSGPQERVDLAFSFPSLEPPELPKHVSADTMEETIQPIDRIFLSITA